MSLRESSREEFVAAVPEKVLITGGAGFIGGHLVARLLDDGHHVVVLDDLSSGSMDRLPEHPKLEVVVGSVLDPMALEQAVRGAQFVINLAGIVGMRLATAEFKRAYEVASHGSKRVLEATGEIPIVMVSSSAVYGRTPRDPVDEGAHITAETVASYDGGKPGYASGKWEMEQHALAAAGNGRRVLVVRPFNVVGPAQTDAYGMVLPTFVRSSLAGRSLEVHDDGQQVRTFSEVGTFIDCLCRLMEAEDAFNLGVVNVGSTTTTSILDLANTVLEETGNTLPVQFVPYNVRFPGREDVRRRRPDIQRLESLIGPIQWPGIREIVQAVISHELQGVEEVSSRSADFETVEESA